MANTQQDTEITLGTGRMLVLFLVFVLVCAVFFAIGFSLGRKTSAATNLQNAPPGTPATIVRPSASKDGTPASATPQSTDLSFYKAVGAKSTDIETTAQDSTAQPSAATGNDASKLAASATPQAAGYFVQVAAVSRQEDANSLVEALKKKQYPAFVANNPSADKFYHVQVGPYAELKEAEAMKARLVGDGYNPIVKK